MASARAKGWEVHELACGHDVMLDQPERLADVLQETLRLRPA
jgi:cytochrome P450